MTVMRGPSTDRNDLGPMVPCARCGHPVAAKTLRQATDGRICVRCSMGPAAPLTKLERAAAETRYDPAAAARMFPATDTAYRKRALARRWRR